MLQVVGVMRDNMQKVLERDAKLGELEDKAGKRIDLPLS